MIILNIFSLKKNLICIVFKNWLYDCYTWFLIYPFISFQITDSRNNRSVHWELHSTTRSENAQNSQKKNATTFMKSTNHRIIYISTWWYVSTTVFVICLLTLTYFSRTSDSSSDQAKTSRIIVDNRLVTTAGHYVSQLLIVLARVVFARIYGRIPPDRKEARY